MANAEGAQRFTPVEDSDSDYESENFRPRGLTGLQNLGNTCYLNSALQSLSNCPPLTSYFLDCPQLIQPEKSPMLSKSYLKLITELWHHKRPSYVVPSGVVTGIKAVHPMFRGYTQQDAQEFLRCLMDQLHEELKSPYSDDSDSDEELEEDEGGGGGGGRIRGTSNGSNNALKAGGERDQLQKAASDVSERRQSLDSSSQSELEYETCDSGLSSERSSNGGRESNGGLSDGNASDTNDGVHARLTSPVVDNNPQTHSEVPNAHADLVRSASSDSIKTAPVSTILHNSPSGNLVRSASSESFKTRSQTASGLHKVEVDFVANTKEMKETANLLEKESEAQHDSFVNTSKVKVNAVNDISDINNESHIDGTAAGSRTKNVVKEGGDSHERGSGEGKGVYTRVSTVEPGPATDSNVSGTEGVTLSGDGAQQQHPQQQSSQYQQPAQQESSYEHRPVGKPAPGVATAVGAGTPSSRDSVQQHQPQLQKQQPVHALAGAGKPRKQKNIRFESIISQTFDGKILSSVRCLNCETVSTIKETFQDLSLPIPSKDHLHMLHSGMTVAPGGMTPPKGGTCGEVRQGWIAWVYSWMKSWFVGPNISLQDCLSAFFSADELKGDNMYSCEKCKKLRNGLKYSRVLDLPEILTIHLKRFRHEFYSSKISTFISFPLEGLDMAPYLHKASNNEATYYDLFAIICHHGTAGGGHYTAYCLNHVNQQWYEFDDQLVTEVDIGQVLSCEAYVLFYRKSNRKMDSIRQKFAEIERHESSILRFYISKQWMSRFHTFAEPGPITNSDFLCKHGGVPPGKRKLIHDLVSEIHQEAWELLYTSFGGGPVCNHLYACQTCLSQLESIRLRQRTEKETFILLNEEFQDEDHAEVVYAINMAWFREWEAFVKEKTDTPPGPIENSRIIVYRNGQPSLRPTSDHGQLSRDMWQFLHRIYGGGPELLVRQSTGASVKPASSSPTVPPPAPSTVPAAPGVGVGDSGGNLNPKV
ncbi:ubiquitin carboxyl-terminal hydrolase 20 [Plakobranchus ocellatus]|uniref:Ubiquitin carboxyl-terminal hydrolase n=1 Tax=Plakobranchus ocellatus TaxID=259542 RepID=A0AAV3ZAK3_9GAST|nr:ubiquitin carboxyl-terminal hydrolase 20 [Plakobranchus ocellatus]